jgi:hypothetical protein
MALSMVEPRMGPAQHPLGAHLDSGGQALAQGSQGDGERALQRFQGRCSLSLGAQDLEDEQLGLDRVQAVAGAANLHLGGRQLDRAAGMGQRDIGVADLPLDGCQHGVAPNAGFGLQGSEQ